MRPKLSLGRISKAVFFILSFSLKSVCHFEKELFGLFPAKTGVSDGFSVHALAYLLASVLDIALYHQALYELFNIVVVLSHVQH